MTLRLIYLTVLAVGSGEVAVKLFKFIVPTALAATIALCAPRANAQTMGEYASTTAGASSGASSMGTTLSNSVATSVDNSGGDSSSRFADSSDRFAADSDRFTSNSELSGSTDRFPSSSLDDHQGGLDTEY